MNVYEELLKHFKEPLRKNQRIINAVSHGPIGRPDSQLLLGEEGENAWHVTTTLKAPKQKYVIFSDPFFEFRKPFVKEFIGDMYDFLESKALVKLAELEKQQVVDDKQVIAHSSPSQNKLNWEKRRTLEREKRKIIREIERLETQIHSFETDLEDRNLLLQQIGEQSIAPPDDAWYEVYEGIRRQLDQCMLLWEQQHIELDAVDKQIMRLQ